MKEKLIYDSIKLDTDFVSRAEYCAEPNVDVFVKILLFYQFWSVEITGRNCLHNIHPHTHSKLQTDIVYYSDDIFDSATTSDFILTIHAFAILESNNWHIIFG